MGDYRSDDEYVLRQHAEWLTHAGVDFVLVDWSNNCDFTYKNKCNRHDLRFIQDATQALFRVWSTIKSPPAPKIAIMIGNPDDASCYTKSKGAAIQAKADEVWELFCGPYKDLYFSFRGKPLLVDYVGTPCPFHNAPPPWTDKRFTVRPMTGFLSDQPNLQGPGCVSKFGYCKYIGLKIKGEKHQRIPFR